MAVTVLPPLSLAVLTTERQAAQRGGKSDVAAVDDTSRIAPQVGETHLPITGMAALDGECVRDS